MLTLARAAYPAVMADSSTLTSPPAAAQTRQVHGAALAGGGRAPGQLRPVCARARRCRPRFRPPSAAQLQRRRARGGAERVWDGMSRHEVRKGAGTGRLLACTLAPRDAHVYVALISRPAAWSARGGLSENQPCCPRPPAPARAATSWTLSAPAAWCWWTSWARAQRCVRRGWGLQRLAARAACTSSVDHGRDTTAPSLGP